MKLRISVCLEPTLLDKVDKLATRQRTAKSLIIESEVASIFSPDQADRLVKGRGYWRPTKRMKEWGFADIRCGPDGPATWKIAAD